VLDLAIITLALSTPLILAAMGGYTSERSGVINIGLEGMMLSAACVSALAGAKYGAVPAVVAALLTATVLSLLHWLATQKYRIDHVVSGMVVNALAAGGTDFFFKKFSDPTRDGGIPALPADAYRYLAIALPFAIAIYVLRTRAGLRLLAVGNDPEKSRLMGVDPLRVRFAGLVATGVFTGLAGAYLVANTGNFTDNMTAGRGYIALAALILGGWKPLPTLAACLVFGFFTALNLTLQGTKPFGLDIPNQAWSSLPYVVTVIALAGFLGRNRTPAGLGKP